MVILQDDFCVERTKSETGDTFWEASQRAGVEFNEENGGGEGVRLRRPTEAKPKEK